jgi:hypothetical protein
LEKNLTNMNCVFWGSIQLCLKYFSLWAEFRKIWSKCLSSREEPLLCLSDFNKTWIFLTYFWKTFKYKIWQKSIQWEPSCSTRTDRQTDLSKLIAAFCNFAKAPNKVSFHICPPFLLLS